MLKTTLLEISEHCRQRFKERGGSGKLEDINHMIRNSSKPSKAEMHSIKASCPGHRKLMSPYSGYVYLIYEHEWIFVLKTAGKGVFDVITCWPYPDEEQVIDVKAERIVCNFLLHSLKVSESELLSASPFPEERMQGAVSRVRRNLSERLGNP